MQRWARDEVANVGDEVRNTPDQRTESQPPQRSHARRRERQHERRTAEERDAPVAIDEQPSRPRRERSQNAPSKRIERLKQTFDWKRARSGHCRPTTYPGGTGTGAAEALVDGAVLAGGLSDGGG